MSLLREILKALARKCVRDDESRKRSVSVDI